MILALEIVLAVVLAGVALLVYMMVRQIGVVSRRLPFNTSPNPDIVEAIAPGEPCPIVQFPVTTADEPIQLPLVHGASSFLLFTSFSCSKCRAIMEHISDLPDHVLDRLVVMVLDTGFADYFSAEIDRLKLNRLRLVEAYELAKPFRVQGVPFLYTVDSDNRITGGSELVTPRDLVQQVRKARAVPTAQGA